MAQGTSCWVSSHGDGSCDGFAIIGNIVNGLTTIGFRDGVHILTCFSEAQSRKVHSSILSIFHSLNNLASLVCQDKLELISLQGPTGQFFLHCQRNRGGSFFVGDSTNSPIFSHCYFYWCLIQHVSSWGSNLFYDKFTSCNFRFRKDRRLSPTMGRIRRNKGDDCAIWLGDCKDSTAKTGTSFGISLVDGDTVTSFNRNGSAFLDTAQTSDLIFSCAAGNGIG